MAPIAKPETHPKTGGRSCPRREDACCAAVNLPREPARCAKAHVIQKEELSPPKQASAQSKVAIQKFVSLKLQGAQEMTWKAAVDVVHVDDLSR